MASTVLNNNEMFYTKYIFFHNCVHISNIKDKHNNKCVSIYMNIINITIINTGPRNEYCWVRSYSLGYLSVCLLDIPTPYCLKASLHLGLTWLLFLFNLCTLRKDGILHRDKWMNEQDEQDKLWLWTNIVRMHIVYSLYFSSKTND